MQKTDAPATLPAATPEPRPTASPRAARALTLAEAVAPGHEDRLEFEFATGKVVLVGLENGEGLPAWIQPNPIWKYLFWRHLDVVEAHNVLAATPPNGNFLDLVFGPAARYWTSIRVFRKAAATPATVPSDALDSDLDRLCGQAAKWVELIAWLRAIERSIGFSGVLRERGIHTHWSIAGAILLTVGHDAVEAIIGPRADLRDTLRHRLAGARLSGGSSTPWRSVTAKKKPVD